LREEKENGRDDEMFIDLTPMSQPFVDRPTFPPNARPIICYTYSTHYTLSSQIHSTHIIIFSLLIQTKPIHPVQIFY